MDPKPNQKKRIKWDESNDAASDQLLEGSAPRRDGKAILCGLNGDCKELQ